MTGRGDTGGEIGRELLALVNRARAAGIDPELELRAAALAYAERVRAWEAGAGWTRSRAAVAARIMAVLTACGRPSVGLDVWRSIVAESPVRPLTGQQRPKAAVPACPPPRLALALLGSS